MTTHPLAQKPVCEFVILYSFPKCGRTWLHIFLHLYDQHLAAEHFVDLANTRLKIVLVRNILDAMVSYYFEVKHRAGFVGDADRKNELLDRWCKSDRSMRSFVRFGVADDFLNFYDECARLTGERILVRYEDLQSDTVGTVTRIATRLAPVLGRELSASAMGAAISACSFESMRALETLVRDGSSTHGHLAAQLDPRFSRQPGLLQDQRRESQGLHGTSVAGRCGISCRRGAGTRRVPVLLSRRRSRVSVRRTHFSAWVEA